MAPEAVMHASDAAASRQAAFNQDLSLFMGEFFRWQRDVAK
jgi:hypothetical protein